MCLTGRHAYALATDDLTVQMIHQGLV